MCSCQQFPSSDYVPGQQITDLLDMGLQVANMKDAEAFTKESPPGVGAWDWDQDKEAIQELMIESGMCPEFLCELLPFGPTQAHRAGIEQLSERWLPQGAKWDLDDTYLALQDIECDIEQGFGGEWMPGSGLSSINRPLSGDAWSSKIVDEVTNELEWAECCEPSYFTEYDPVTEQTDFVRDRAGRETLIDAQRHDQHCSLNQLFNSPVGSSQRRMVCKVVCVGEKYGVAVTELGAAFIPKSCLHKIPEVGGEFMGVVGLSDKGKYSLRVKWVQ